MKSSARLLILFAICLSLSATARPANARNSSDQLKVTLLGTGTPYPSADRFGASILVEADGKKLLFDCVIGHHGHLSPWLQAKSSAALPRVWIKGREDDPLRFRPMLAAAGEELNDVTSSTSVSILLALLSGETLHVSTPGVAGLPGGYPFLLKRGKFSLRLPRGITREQAIAHNKSGEHADGLDLGPAVKFTEPARRALAAVSFEFAEGFAFEEWQAARNKLLALRDRLRSQPA
jgi:hypothetical protein